jgi:hypothetical protein
MTKKILVFSPYQAIYPHSFIETKMAELLKEHDGAEISAMTCDEDLLPYCTSMASFGLTASSPMEEKKRICSVCKSYRNDILNSKIFSRVTNLREGVTTEIQKILAQEKNEIHSLLTEYQYQGVKIGRLCSYEFILSNKIKSVQEIPASLAENLAAEIFNGLKVFLVMEAYLKANSVDFIIFYNGHYSLSQIVSSLCERFFPKTKTVAIHYGYNWNKPRDKLYITSTTHFAHLQRRLRHFKEILPKGILKTSPSKETEIADYVKRLYTATSVFTYSSAKQNQGSSELLKQFALDPKKPVALLSMSSSDELYALRFAILQNETVNTDQSVFKSQDEWLQKTIEFFKTHNDLQLIVRIHPREFPNKREKVLSQSALDFDKLKEGLPENIKLNMPSDNISIYDLFDLIHLHLTSWSSVGMESSLLGIPTLSSYDSTGLYPSSTVHDYAPDEKGYFGLIPTLMQAEKNPNSAKTQKQIQLAKEWLMFEFNEAVLVYETNNYWNKKGIFLRRVINKFLLPFATHRYRDFSKHFSISREEIAHLKTYFETFEDFHTIKIKKN